MSRCERCGRPSFLFGSRDVESGWEGWCKVCNWMWRYSDVQKVFTFKLLRWVSEDRARVHIRRFLVYDNCYERWESGVAVLELREIHRVALFKIWSQILLAPSNGVYVRDGMSGAIRECDSGDETDSGVADAELDYVNPLWRLQLARPRGKIPGPFQVLVRMLGKPFENDAILCMENSL